MVGSMPVSIAKRLAGPVMNTVTYENQQDNGEQAHKVEHEAAEIMSNDLGNTLAVFTQGDHARHIVVHAAGENSTEYNPKINARTPESTAERTEYRTEAGDIQKLNHKYLPSRKRDVVNAVIDSHGRRWLISWLEDCVNQLAVD